MLPPLPFFTLPACHYCHFAAIIVATRRHAITSLRRRHADAIVASARCCIAAITPLAFTTLRTFSIRCRRRRHAVFDFH
jgi:hypothetical protein